jgi:hypothetical protein
MPGVAVVPRAPQSRIKQKQKTATFAVCLCALLIYVAFKEVHGPFILYGQREVRDE